MGDMREKYESLALNDLKELAKARGIKITGLKKADLVESMLEEDKKDAEKGKEVEVKPVLTPANTQNATAEEKFPAELDSGVRAHGILEVMPDGYGFIRCENYLPGENDVYVAPSQIRRFNLKTGDIIEGNTRVKTQGEKFSALLYLKKINGFPPEVAVVKAIDAGVDVLMLSEKKFLNAARILIAESKRNPEFKNKIDAAVKRVLAFKNKYGLLNPEDKFNLMPVEERVFQFNQIYKEGQNHEK